MAMRQPVNLPGGRCLPIPAGDAVGVGFGSVLISICHEVSA